MSLNTSESSDDSNSTQTRAKRSKVWEHFEQNLVEVDNCFRAVCKYCRMQLSTKSGTSSLRTHISQYCHAIGEAERNRFIATLKKPIENFVFDPQFSRERMIEFVIHAEIPFNKFEDPYFEPWVQSMQPTLSVVGRQTVRNDCLKKYQRMKQDIQNELESLDSHVCLTSDLWTSIQNLGYMVVTAHYITPDFKIKKKIGMTISISLSIVGTVNISAAYNTRHRDFESSVVARGDLWRLESSHGSLNSGNDSSPLFLIQVGPLLFVRDSTLLLPVHLSKQHLLWYGYDRKNRMHSLCPAIWSKHRKWMLMSMMCLNPVTCSFMDVQFPNGQLTYVAGEGITASGFFPLFGGLLQAHGKCPGETKVSFSFKSKQGTRFTPMFQWPDNSLSVGVAQAVAWKKSGLMVRPSIQVSVCPTFGGSDPGIRAEFVHSLKEELNVMCGFSCSRHPSAFTALSLGRSKWNGQVGSSGLVITLETPLDNMAMPSLSVQLNGGFEF